MTRDFPKVCGFWICRSPPWGVSRERLSDYNSVSPSENRWTVFKQTEVKEVARNGCKYGGYGGCALQSQIFHAELIQFSNFQLATNLEGN